VLALESEKTVQYLPDILKQSEEERWTGILDVCKGQEQFGTVFLHQGRIAWAASKDQSKNFGFFLEKIGMIPKQRQKEIFDKFKALGKNRDFGAVIEETGLISRSKLRECLRGHIQAAISSLLDNSGITFKQRECDIAVTPDLLFSLDEILRPVNAESVPQSNATSSYSGESDCRPVVDNLNNILETLASLTGYQYSFICNPEAEVLASHKSDSLALDLDEILISSTAWIVSSAAKLHELRIGRMDFVLVEHDKGSLIARCPSEENGFFIAASFNENGKPGVIKHKISEMMSSVHPVME
jgi:hypothetical protein